MDIEDRICPDCGIDLTFLLPIDYKCQNCDHEFPRPKDEEEDTT